MKNYSTLIYCVNKFRAESFSTPSEVDNAIEMKLTGMGFEPSEKTLKNILDFANSYEVLESEFRYIHSHVFYFPTNIQAPFFIAVGTITIFRF